MESYTPPLIYDLSPTMENDEQRQQTPPPFNQTYDIDNSNRSNEQAAQQQPEPPLPNCLDEFMQYYTRNITTIRDKDGDHIRLPLGMRFVPQDQELVYYLIKMILNEPIHNELIKYDKLYGKSPDELTVGHTCAIEDIWYYYTSRDKKYPKGQRPNRRAGEGFWKATGKDVPIMYKGQTVGFRKALIYQQGDAKQNSKTSWMMHEYIVNQDLLRGHQVRCTSSGSMELNKYVLSKVYKKKEKDRTEEGSSVSITSAGVARKQENLQILDVKGTTIINDHGNNSNNVQPAPALRIGNGDVNVKNHLGSSNCPPRNVVRNDQANLDGMVQLPNATTTKHENISENNVCQITYPNWSIGGPRPNDYRPNSVVPANYWQNRVSHQSMRGDYSNRPGTNNCHSQNGVPHQSMHGDHNCMPGTNNYSSQNGVLHKYRPGDYNYMLGSNNYYSQNGVPHQFRNGDQSNNLAGNNNNPPLLVPANRRKRLFDQMANVYHNNSLSESSNNPHPPAYRHNRVVHQIRNNVPGISNNQPRVAPPNQQNGAPNQFTNGDHSNNLSGTSNNHPPVAPANQFNNADHNNNVPGSNNHHSQNGVPNDQIMNPNYPQNTTMLDFDPSAAVEGYLIEENGDDDEQVELTEEHCAFLRDNFSWNVTD